MIDDVPTAVENIFLQENKLRELPADLLTLSNLKELNCDENPIEHIPEEWFHTSRKLSVHLTEHKDTTACNVRDLNQGKVEFIIIDANAEPDWGDGIPF